MSINVELKDFPKIIGAEYDRQIPQMREAVKRGILRSVSGLLKASPIDTGRYANSWDFKETEKSIILGNHAPHAGIIEFGARPFTPPLDPLLAWAKRVLGDPSQPPEYSPEVRSLAFAVQRKISQHGMKPKHILKNYLPTILENIKREFNAIK